MSEWDAHWEQYAESAEWNPAQAYRRRLIRSLLAVEPGHDHIVDVGSGQGDLAVELRQDFPWAKILGLELSQSGVDIATAKVPDAVFLRRDLTTAGDPAPGYEHWGSRAVCSEVLEHVDEPGVLLANAVPYLTPGCRVVVTVPGGPRSAFDRHIGHRRHYRAHELRDLLQSAGLRVDRVLRAGFPFFNLYKLLVIARGRHLIDDVSVQDEKPPSRVARAVMRVFGVLFKLNLPSFPGGWQLVAVAHVPDR